MRHRLPAIVLTGAAAAALVLGATGAASAAPRPSFLPANVSFTQCTDGGGHSQLEEPWGILCVGGTYNGQWIAGSGPIV